LCIIVLQTPDVVSVWYIYTFTFAGSDSCI